MADPYTLYANLEAEAPIPGNGILSRTLHNDDHLKVVLFGFAEGEELSAHTAPMAASLYIVRGEARLTLGAQTHEVKAGAFVHMAPQLQHAIVARTPVVMLLSMYKQARP
jgi:quercetin dioxygenase-like cupin family protein